MKFKERTSFHTITLETPHRSHLEAVLKFFDKSGLLHDPENAKFGVF